MAFFVGSNKILSRDVSADFIDYLTLAARCTLYVVRCMPHGNIINTSLVIAMLITCN